MRKIAIVILFLFLTSGYSYSQDDPGNMVTDRPDQTESPYILQPGYVQVESGFNYLHYSYTDPNNIAKLSSNNYNMGSLIRIGIFPSTEIRIAPEYLSRRITVSFLNPAFTSDFEADGFLPLTLGAKIKITDESKYIPAAAFLFQADIPGLASGDFTDGNSNVEFRGVFSKTLSDRFSIGANLGGIYGTYIEDVLGLYTLSFSGEIYKGLGAFIELYGYFRDGSEPNHSIDGGLAYRILKNLQIDFSAGTMYSDDFSDFFIGGGLSVRLPR